MKTDIAIVGGGPVGLLLAILLGKQGRDVVLVERYPEIYQRPRAVTMDAEVARILATLGIDVDSDPGFENHKELYYWKNAQLENLQIVDWESLAPSSWHVTYWFNQPDLEARLFAMAADYPSVRVLRGWEAVGLAQDDASATLTGANGDTIEARFLVGADGANSFVREALGLPVVDKGYFFDWLILDMIPEASYKTSPAQWQLCDPKRPTTIVPGGPGRRRWEFMVLPGEDADALASEESAWRLLEPWGLSPENAELERSAVYRFQARYADKWRAGRCLIAGDAAHLMPPFAGEGMCAGLRDATALAWRLGSLLDGHFSDEVLDSYESERKEHAKHYIQFSQDLGDIICIADEAKAAERDARMIADLKARGGEPITGDLVELGEGAWIKSPTAGELSPQGVVRFEGREDRFDQAVGHGWFILSLKGSAEGLLTPAQEAAWSRLGGRVLSVGEFEPQDTTYADWGADYVILRPDFYTAATATSADELRAHFDTLLLALTYEER
ncbi:MAG: bifunctional 3-(3-hydroxy-phenyl)propionate/3-hydroxycinnamic acid hydroxylase [Pseudomonadota bacterium]